MFPMANINPLLDVDLIIKKAKVGDKKKVADFGCGTNGCFVFGPAKLVGKHGKSYAVDILKPILENIRRQARQYNLENVEIIWSDLEVFKATKIETGSLDAGLLINTLYQSHKRYEMLRECVRMVKKGGILEVVDWKDASSPFGPPAEERVNVDSLIKACAKLGLKMEEEFKAGDYHFGLVFVKL